jgi:probable F420-dependent oxidoreductase
MKFGLSIFPTDYSIRPGELAAAAEERGFDSFWVPEHSHLPVSPITPGHDQGGLPNMYYDVADPFVALAMAAQATRELLLGTSICLVVQRDPIQLAKQVASLDALSDGRFLFGVGGGWNPLEMANHGTDYAERLAIMDERIAAMKRIWTEEQAEYHGEYVDFGPMYAWPKPARKPHPPIHVAVNAPKGLGRVVRHGDGWFPLPKDGDPDSVIDHLPTLRQALTDAGRDPDAVEVSVYICPPVKDTVVRFRDAGIDRVIFLLDPSPRDEALAQVDERAELMAACR